jgi:hypothetical protein
MSGTGEEEDLAAAWGAALEEEGSTEAQAEYYRANFSKKFSCLV